MLKFIDNYEPLKKLSTEAKRTFVEELEKCFAGEPTELHVSYNHFQAWLNGYPRTDPYVPPENLDTLVDTAFKDLLIRTVLDAWLLTDRTSSHIDARILKKFDVYSFVDALLKTDLVSNFAHDEDILSHIPFETDTLESYENTISVGSSNGAVLADRNGHVLELDNGWQDTDAAIPAKFDFTEYEQHYGHPVPDYVDILDLGFASWDGNIVEPVHDWRAMIKSMDEQ